MDAHDAFATEGIRHCLDLGTTDINVDRWSIREFNTTEGWKKRIGAAFPENSRTREGTPEERSASPLEVLLEE